MRINTHCHIFNVKSIYTNGFKENFRSRAKRTLESLGVPLSEGLLNTFMKIIDDLVCCAPTGAAGNSVLEQREFLFRKLTGLLKPLFTVLFGKVPFVDFLAIALLPDIDLVTDYLFMRDEAASAEEDTREVILVPLMMDILQTTGLLPTYHYPAETTATMALIEKQVDGTKRQVLRHPGRVLPFYAVNPLRPRFAADFEQAMEQGFVGLKLYPSLGYHLLESAPPGSPGFVFRNEFIATLSECNRSQYPVLMHCNDGGFALSESTSNWCEPFQFKHALSDELLLNLKWCYGHFGGGTFFTRGSKILKRLIFPNLDHLWNKNIQTLMKSLGDRIFADVSCHVEALKPENSKAYFDALEAVLADPVMGGQILWGTDYFLDQMYCDEYEFWVHFEDQLNERNPNFFRRMSHDNPIRFLGLPDKNGKVGKNIKNYARFVYKNRKNAAFNPDRMAKWLRGYFDAHRDKYPDI